jgi:hypothetical protein
MRRAKSYSIVDHQLLHGGYLNKLDHKSSALYLFLIVVSDREGKSYYSPHKIMKIVQLTADEFQKSLSKLIHLKLVQHRHPNFFIESISQPCLQYNTTVVKESVFEQATTNVTNPSTETNNSESELIDVSQLLKDFFIKLDKKTKN